MKKTLTLAVLGTLLHLFAFATEPHTDSQNHTPHSPAASLATYEKVARENEALKSDIARLAEANEELRSQIAYQTMMANMLLTLKQQEAEDQIAELEATVAYDEMMGNMLTKLEQAASNDKQEEAIALVVYQKMMENMFRKITLLPNR